LVKIAVQAWYNTVLKNGTPQSSLVDFAFTASGYYADAKKLALTFNTTDFAYLALACSIHLPLEETIPGSSLHVEDLENASVIFRSSANSYVMPLLWWVHSRTQQNTMSLHWNRVNNNIQQIVPGVKLEDLHVSPLNLAKLQIHTTDMGHFYEKLLASSLAVKYQLFKLQHPGEEVFLSNIIDILDSEFYSNAIDWSKGVCVSEIEAIVGSGDLHAICLNIKVHHAHHDIVVSNAIGFSCKNSMIWPQASEIIQQLEGIQGGNKLLWCFLGADRKSPNWKNQNVCDALKEKRLAFISGNHVISDVTLDLLKSIKLVFENSLKDNNQIPK